MADKNDLENFGMVLGLVKAVKLESMDESIKKSMEFMQNTITELSKTIAKLQESLIVLLSEGEQESFNLLSERLAETISVYNQATEAMCSLLVQHISSSLQIKDTYSKVDMPDNLTEDQNPEQDPS